jgi:hypothetical protein
LPPLHSKQFQYNFETGILQLKKTAKKMKKNILNSLTALLLTLCAPAATSQLPLSLQEKFEYANQGDFIVTAQEGNYSLLFIRSLTTQTLLLEEISVPAKQVELKDFDWRKWVEKKAPGHTSWTLYEVDRASGKLIECFSYSKNAWLFLDNSKQFLAHLLMLPLFPVPLFERKKIGPQVATEEEDRRAIWTPPLFVEGKKIPNPTFDVLKTQWPNDGSHLSLSRIELYFAKDRPHFPFPYWLEVHSPHYTFKMRAIDSGTQLSSCMPGPMPHRPPQILGSSHRGKESWKLFIQTPPYFQSIHLFVIDLSARSKETIPISCTSTKGSGSEEMILEISCSELNKTLKNGHRYQWILIPQGSKDIYIESEEVFTFWYIPNSSENFTFELRESSRG